MSDAVIRVENLSKRFLIGAAQSQHLNLGAAVQRSLAQALTRKRVAQHANSKSSEIFWALQEITFEVNRGDVFGVIGHNGAGKSTLLKILARITPPTSGRARIDGRLGSLLEVGTGFHPELTGRANIFLNGAVLGMKRNEIAKRFDQIVDFAEVEQFIDTPVKFYSSGMYMRLAFAVAAHLDTEILLIDEVLAVGDAAFQQKSLGKMNDIASNQGRTILFVSHALGAVKALCNRAILLDHGRITRWGTASEGVDHYLGSVETPLTQVDLPEDPAIRVQILSARIDPLPTSDGDTEILFHCTYRVKQELENLLLCVEVFNERNVSVYYSNNDYLEDNRKRRLGTHTVTLRIPTSMFSPGEYQVAFGFWEPGFDYAEHFPRERLRFRREEQPSRLTRHAVKWPSVIYSPFGWNYVEGKLDTSHNSELSEEYR
ncbi:MAG: ATP-binding cassette domain-containing protein [Chloroflexi bacterium]|uniref:ABC transporter ATP-binding protein n=1 Tax=Candidatus Flexifilum breve TaxID=3140694 RepID=UPI0031364F8A|nr:ATP-binding cassette domain-containing protein [Chloroflexota bacterium]